MDSSSPIISTSSTSHDSHDSYESIIIGKGYASLDSRPRKNTISEKRKMRNARKKRMKKKKISGRIIKRELKEAQRNAKKHELSVKRLTAMARSYWERWRWELQKRKEALFTTTRLGMHSKHVYPNIHEIEEAFLPIPLLTIVTVRRSIIWGVEALEL